MPLADDKSHSSSSSKKSSNFLPALIIFLVFVTIGGFLFYFQSGPDSSTPDTPSPHAQNDTSLLEKPVVTGITDKTLPAVKTPADNFKKPESGPGSYTQLSDVEREQHEITIAQEPVPEDVKKEQAPINPPLSGATDENQLSQCEKTTENINQFYRHLDQQQYMTNYHLTTSSKIHFTALIDKLLANPPQVTRETDDLYTILKNTAHFFRISGKDNILMLKGILDSERGLLEDILANYYFLISTSDCSDTPYVLNIDQDALYEYACFFLNTMGGRLYLFRRDSLSRMVVTYYAIAIINQANNQNNNRHGIDLKSSIDMLIAEMEAGGSTLKKQESYLDTLYTLKERYQ